MKKALLLSSEPPVKPKVMYVLSRRSKNNKLESIATTYTNLAIFLDSEKNASCIYVDNKMADISGVYFRVWSQFPSMSIALAHILKLKKIPFVNSDVGLGVSDSKSYDYCRLFNTIPLPKTILAYPDWLIKNNAIIAQNIRYPIIVKASDGKKGYDNYLIHSIAELSKTLKKYNRDTLFCAQEYIPNLFDYRIVVVGFKVKQAYIRTRNPKLKTHVNNVSQGGSKSEIEVKSVPLLCTIAEKAAKTLKREICGVDLIVNSESKKAYLIEVSSSPDLPYTSTFEILQRYLESRLT